MSLRLPPNEPSVMPLIYPPDWWFVRLKQHIIEQPNGCHIWMGVRSTKDGYAQYNYGRFLTILVHRILWMYANGSVPLDRELHHKCEVKACVNIKHLIALTDYEHRRQHAGEYVCKNGHPRTSINTYHNSRGNTICRDCDRERYHRRSI